MSDDNKEGAGEPVMWQERQKLSTDRWSDWYESGSTCTVGKTAAFSLDSGGVPFEFRPLYAAPSAVMPAAPSDEVTEEMLAAGAKFSSQPRATYKAMRAALSQTTQPQAAQPAGQEQAGAVAYLMTTPRGSSKWALMPEELPSNLRASFERDGISIQPLYLAAPGAAIAAREHRAETWLIEDQDHFPRHRWLRIVEETKRAYLSWTEDANIAARFARREDAVGFQKLHVDFCALSIVTGHTFMDMPGALTQSTTVQQAEGAQLLDFRCSNCGSQPGVPCVGPTSGTHVERFEALRAAVPGSAK